jgi:hypothetical protein
MARTIGFNGDTIGIVIPEELLDAGVSSAAWLHPLSIQTTGEYWCLAL